MSIFETVFSFVGNNILDLAGGVWGALGVITAYLTKKYLVPLMQVEKRRRYATWIAAIADEVTDDLRARYPGHSWLERLDEAVDRVIVICGIEPDIAGRAVRASVSRKK